MKSRTYLCMLAAALLITTSCALPRLDLFMLEHGSLELELNTAHAKTITPLISTTPATFEISGSGPHGETFTVSTAESSVTLEDLSFGTWDITVRAYNSANLLIGEGFTAAEIHTNELAALAVDVLPVSGSGTLSVNVSWKDSLVFDPSITGILEDGGGTQFSLGLVPDGSGAATAEIPDIAAGYYTLTVRLLDGGVTVAGLTEAVRILTGETTTGSFLFENLNKPGQSIEVQSTSFTLAWDPPADDSAITGYRVYYRQRGTYAWQTLEEVAADPTPALTVTSAMLPYGSYEFAVSSLAGTYESDLHKSMADDASPATGWYIDWSAGG